MFPGLATHGLQQKPDVDRAWAHLEGGGDARGQSLLAGLAAGQRSGAQAAPGSMMLGGLNMQGLFGTRK
jgi:hypothetical protein